MEAATRLLTIDPNNPLYIQMLEVLYFSMVYFKNISILLIPLSLSLHIIECSQEYEPDE